MTKHQIIHADCRKALKKIKPCSVHMLLTDPPYFLDGLCNKWQKAHPTSPRATGCIGGLPVGMKFDPRQGHALQNFIQQVAAQALPVLKPGAFALFFSQPRLVHRMACGIEDAGFEIRDLYAWHFTKKAQAKAFGLQHFVDKMKVTEKEKTRINNQLKGKKTAQLRPQFESIILAQKPKQGTYIQNWLKYRVGLMNVAQGPPQPMNLSLQKKYINPIQKQHSNPNSKRTNTKSNTKSIKTQKVKPKRTSPAQEPPRLSKVPTTVMQFEKPQRTHTHLTPKPVDLLEHLIQLFTQPGQVVLDPFLGSGSTSVACQNTGRVCIGIEVQSQFIDLTHRRLDTSLEA